MTAVAVGQAAAHARDAVAPEASSGSGWLVPALIGAGRSSSVAAATSCSAASGRRHPAASTRRADAASATHCGDQPRLRRHAALRAAPAVPATRRAAPKTPGGRAGSGAAGPGRVPDGERVDVRRLSVRGPRRRQGDLGRQRRPRTEGSRRQDAGHLRAEVLPAPDGARRRLGAARDSTGPRPVSASSTCAARRKRATSSSATASSGTRRSSIQEIAAGQYRVDISCAR